MTAGLFLLAFSGGWITAGVRADNFGDIAHLDSGGDPVRTGFTGGERDRSGFIGEKLHIDIVKGYANAFPAAFVP